jgi:hypothetical protein
MKKIYTKEELIQIVLTSKQVKLESIYPATALYIISGKNILPLAGFVINETYLADKYSGDVFNVDDPNLTDLANLEEFDF